MTGDGLITALSENLREVLKDYKLQAEGQTDKKVSVYKYDIPHGRFESDTYIPYVIVTPKLIDLVEREANAFTFEVECSAGTYIRALCRDMASAMGTVGYMQKLVRVRSGEFDLSHAVYLKDIEQYIGAGFLPLTDFAANLPAYNIDETYRKNIENGVTYPLNIDQTYARIDIGGAPYAIGYTPDGILKIICRL